MIHWILERNVFSEKCFDRMVKHFQDHNIPYDIVTIIPFVHEIDGKVPVVTGDVVCYGSIGMQEVAQKHGWKPGVWNTYETWDNIPVKDRMFNKDYTSMPLKDVAGYISKWTRHTKFFIKPETDDKQFAGTIITKKDFGKWLKGMNSIGYLQDNNFNVVIATPKHVDVEWRVVVVNGKVSSYSTYRKYGIKYTKNEIEPGALEFANEMIAQYQPAPVFCIDIVRSEEEYSIMEFTTFNSGGLYECDVDKIIDDIGNMMK